MGCCKSTAKAKEKPQGISGKINKDKRTSKVLLPGNFVSTSFNTLETDYEIQKQLGEGSFGSVSVVKHRVTGLQRARKRIKLNRFSDSLEAIKELEIMREIDHPNIVRVYEMFRQQKHIDIVMELCTGGELFDEIVKNGSFSENKAAQFTFSLLSALNYLHSLNIVHRDIKPENLLLDNSDKSSLKLVDFGTAITLEQGEKLNAKIGTSYYVAPEVLRGKYDHRCDIWSAGVILYIMLCGCPPFNAPVESKIYAKILNSKLEFRKHLWNNISRNAIDLVTRMLDKNPDKRISIKNALKHPWILAKIQGNAPEKLIAVDSLRKLKGFNIQSKMQRATLAFISSQLFQQQEIANLKKVFDAMNRNHDGKISRLELEQALAEYLVECYPSVDEVFEKCDIDGSGFIDYNEFIIASTDWSKAISKKKLYQAFKMYDLDCDGKISIEEIQKVLMEEGENEHYFFEIMKEVDTNGDGEIDFEEFSAYLMGNIAR